MTIPEKVTIRKKRVCGACDAYITRACQRLHCDFAVRGLVTAVNGIVRFSARLATTKVRVWGEFRVPHARSHARTHARTVQVLVGVPVLGGLG